MERVDLLILTALKEEYEAVVAVDTGAAPGDGWREETVDGVHRASLRTFAARDGAPLRVAVTWATSMGGVATAAAVQPSVARYRPDLLAMCGVCAGRRGEVALGDVIAADRVWSYDFGAVKRTYRPDGTTAEVFEADLTTWQVAAPWKQRLERYRPDSALAKPWLDQRPLPYHLQLQWLLERLFANEAPAAHPERPRRCPDWTKVLGRHWKLPEGEQLVDRELRLTAGGARQVRELRALHPDGLPWPAPFQVVTGVLATGNQVVRDERIFDRLASYERKVLGLEMEAAALGALAHLQGLPMLVMKGVMDHADPEKNDNFKSFAARASAECLIDLARTHHTGAVASPGGEADVYQGLVALLPSQLEEIVFLLALPAQHLSSETQAQRALSVVRLCRQRGRLGELRDALTRAGA